jgi:hypothetical protein
MNKDEQIAALEKERDLWKRRCWWFVRDGFWFWLLAVAVTSSAVTLAMMIILETMKG